MLWFDVEIGYYTTGNLQKFTAVELWFDVEIGYYTTVCFFFGVSFQLWFDVEIGYYTTIKKKDMYVESCDLM